MTHVVDNIMVSEYGNYMLYAHKFESMTHILIRFTLSLPDFFFFKLWQEEMVAIYQNIHRIGLVFIDYFMIFYLIAFCVDRDVFLVFVLCANNLFGVQSVIQRPLWMNEVISSFLNWFYLT